MASRTALSIDDPRFNQLQDIPPKLRTAYAQVIFDRTHDYKKALRCAECGRRMKKKAGDGCIATLIQHCMTGFCEYCADKLRDKTCERWRHTLQLLIEACRGMGTRHFTLVRIQNPIDADTHQLKQFFSGISQANFHKELRWKDFETAIDPFFKNMRGYINGRVDVRILYLNSNLTIGDWLALFPRATVRVWYFEIDRLLDVFKDDLLEPYLPHESHDRGEQEALFNGIQRFAADGTRIDKSAPEIEDNSLFAEEESSANNGGDPVPPGPNCGMGKCVHGVHFSERTKWYGVAEPIPPADLIEWERVAPLPIQT